MLLQVKSFSPSIDTRHVTPGKEFQSYYCRSSCYSRVELFGFQDVMMHMAGGYRISFYISETDCKDPSTMPGEFHEPFGGTVDFYFQYTEDNVMTAQFSISKFERNSTGGLITILRQAFLTQTDEAYWMISVLTPDKSEVISSWSFACAFGNNTKNSNVLRFFADETSQPQQMHSFDDIKSALMTGSQVWYNAMFFLCKGDVPWTVTGGRVRDFDIIVSSSQEIISSSLNALVRRTGTVQSEYIVVTSTLHDNRVVNFEVTDNDAKTFNMVYNGTKMCYLQTTMPGGTVNYYVV
ncbi:unnamed protein product [Mytilus coruscus]|uniref:Uncharacterized protein n=1 Tax=Mytilus coruscus TaxID=42192 RepID=A0A6J8EYU2_MYTCO|nr:unnamed protein product [Mytilus coruscus]